MALPAGAGAIFDRFTSRTTAIRAFNQQAQADCQALLPLVNGRHLVKRGIRYAVVDINYSFDGSLHARGYRIKTNGKRGSQVWDIGFICASYFNDAESIP